MTLAPGTRFGPYEIKSILGSGGMGVVYRARDPRIGRDVAIKVLQPSLSNDPEALRRFQQEVRAVGAVSHANIVSVFDTGTESGIAYVVSELVEGETLRARLADGPLPTRKAVDYAVQICEGLAAAHKKGIVHRDLKPENVMVANDGRVKILDFGLAKLARGDGRGSIPAHESTGSLHLQHLGTEAGTVLGTVGYMSPEQVRGEAADQPSDVFSFGATFYEMLSGRRAFRGASAVETLNSILKEDPPSLLESMPSLSPIVDRIVRRCLEKDPADRFHAAHDLALALEMSASAEGPSTRRRTLGEARWALISAAAVLVGGAAVAASWIGAAEDPKVPALRRLTFRNGNVLSARFAPDGQTVVYGGAWDGRPRELFSTRVDSLESRPMNIGDSEIAGISSKGELILALGCRYNGHLLPSQGTLARVPLAGGAPRPFLQDAAMADWSRDGTAMAVIRWERGTSRLEYPVGTLLYETKGGLAFPRISPDGRSVAFLEYPASLANGALTIIEVGGRKRTLTKSEYRPYGVVWAPDGREIWFIANDTHGASPLYAVDLSGRARVVFRFAGWASLQDISSDGRVLVVTENVRIGIVVRGQGSADRELSWLDGSNLSDLADDGRRVLISELAAAGGSLGAIYIRGTDGSPAVRLGEGKALDLSPDGNWVLAQLRTQPPELSVLPVGAGQRRVLPLPGTIVTLRSGWFFPDSKRVIVAAKEDDGTMHAYLYDIDERRPRRLGNDAFEDVLGPLSPDGSELPARASGGDAVMISVEGGAVHPIRGLESDEYVFGWSRDSRSVFVASGADERGSRARLFRVEPATGRRDLWKEVSLADGGGLMWISPRVTPDGATYAFGYMRVLSDLYLVEGLR